MMNKELIDHVYEIFPAAEIVENDGGELVIHTGIQACKETVVDLGQLHFTVRLSGDPAIKGLVGEVTSNLKEGDDGSNPELTAAYDTIESFVLAAACAEVHINSASFKEALENTIEAVTTHFA